MRKYKYQYLINITYPSWNGSFDTCGKGYASNIKEFSETIRNQFIAFGYTVNSLECHKAEPETKRERKYYSMAFVDMGQCSR